MIVQVHLLEDASNTHEPGPTPGPAWYAPASAGGERQSGDSVTGPLPFYPTLSPGSRRSVMHEPAVVSSPGHSSVCRLAAPGK